MDHTTESRRKEAQFAEQQCNKVPPPPYGGGAACGEVRGMGSALREPMRENLIGRVRNRLSRAMKGSLKGEQMHELLCLLEKNPDIARILDLIEEVNC